MSLDGSVWLARLFGFGNAANPPNPINLTNPSNDVRQTLDSVCPSLSFFVFRYFRVNSVDGAISSGIDSETERP